MVLADRVAVMLDGKLQQIGSADSIYHFPETVSVARFTGNPQTNLLPGVIFNTANTVCFRPEGVTDGWLELLGAGPGYNDQQVIVHVRPEDAVVVPATWTGTAASSGYLCAAQRARLSGVPAPPRERD